MRAGTSPRERSQAAAPAGHPPRSRTLERCAAPAAAPDAPPRIAGGRAQPRSLQASAEPGDSSFQPCARRQAGAFPRPRSPAATGSRGRAPGPRH
eukprot:3670055-Heterocapsa_arctica.AAC.1